MTEQDEVRVIPDRTFAKPWEVIWRRKDGLMIAGRPNSKALYRFRQVNQQHASDWQQIVIPRSGAV